MKRIWFALICLLLTGCSLDPNAAEQYRTEEKLDASITMDNSQIQIKTASNAHVSILFWEKGGEKKPLTVRKTEKDIFVAEKKIEKNGVYFIKADIKTDRQHIMPTKKIVVGGQEELKQDNPERETHSHH